MKRNSLKYYTGLLFIILAAAGCRNSGAPESEEKPGKLSPADLSAMNRELAHKEQERIESYIRRHALEMKMTNTGLWYLISDKGEGEKAVSGDRIRLEYTCSLLDGTRVYSSEREGLKEFILGYGNVESGLNEACAMLAEGGKGTFILPPHLAHGLLGDERKIPARATLVYEIKVVNIN